MFKELSLEISVASSVWIVICYRSFRDHEIRRLLLLGRKAMSNLDSIFQPRQSIKKQKHYFANKGPPSQSFGFPMSHVRMWELDHKESWGPKNWCLRIVVLEKTPESFLGARRSSQSILKEINPEYSLEGLMLKLQYFGHLMWRANSLEKTLMLGKIEARRKSGWERMRFWMASLTQSMDLSLIKLQEIVKDREA